MVEADSPPSGVVVDVGLGKEPWTALDLRDVVAPAPLVVIDIDADRVANARSFGLDARVGSFTSAVTEPARIVRAMNLLRAYREDEIESAHAALGVPLVEGGILIEGTTDATGSVVTAWVLRRADGQLARERLLFLTDFSRGFAPGLFWDHLPRDLRRSAVPGTPIRDFLDAWQRATACGRTADPRETFDASVRALDRPDVARVEDGIELRWTTSPCR